MYVCSFQCMLNVRPTDIKILVPTFLDGSRVARGD